MPELSSAKVYGVGETVVKGDDIALHQIPELMAVSRIEIVGPLPSDLHSIRAFSAAVLGTSKEAEAAKTLVEFLRSPGTAAGLRAKGFEM
jgi:molybdate transport system substrate-binding protein